MQIPLPSVRLRLPASSPAGGRSLFGWLLSLGAANSIRLLPLGGSCRRKATEGAYAGAVCRFGSGVAVGKQTAVPVALQLPPPSGTTCQLPPPLGEEAFWGGFSSSWSAKPLVTCLLSWLSAHANSGFEMQQNQLQHPPAGPHRDDRERRQIPVPFFGAA